MTENEAINELQANIDLPFGFTVSDEVSEMAIQALEEIQQYRAIIGLTADDLKTLEKDEIQTIGDALKIFSEWHKYRAIGTVEECEKAIDFELAKQDKSLAEVIDEYLEYRAIGAIEEFKTLKEHIQIIQEAYENTDGYKDGYAKAIDEFAEKIIIMMPGHRQDIEQIADKMKGAVQ